MQSHSDSDLSQNLDNQRITELSVWLFAERLLYSLGMEIHDTAEEIRLLCRQIIASADDREVDVLVARLRALLREQTQNTRDQAAHVLVMLLESERRLKHAS